MSRAAWSKLDSSLVFTKLELVRYENKPSWASLILARRLSPTEPVFNIMYIKKTRTRAHINTNYRTELKLELKSESMCSTELKLELKLIRKGLDQAPARLSSNSARVTPLLEEKVVLLVCQPKVNLLIGFSLNSL